MQIFKISGLVIIWVMGLTSLSFADFTEFDQFGTGSSQGVAWGDYDNDGDLDLAVTNVDTFNRLYRNVGSGNFTELEPFNPFIKTSRGLAWGDYDNDEDLDLVVVSGENQQNELYKNNGDGSFTRFLRFGIGDSYGTAWGDYDNDGDLDLVVSNFGSVSNSLWGNDGSDFFTSITNFGVGGCKGSAWGDYDNDGDSDLAVVSWQGSQGSKLYTNNGSDSLLESNLPSGLLPEGITWGDYDNDGDLDLAESQLGINQIFRNDSLGAFKRILLPGQAGGEGVAWGDYDNDGDLDVAIAKYQTKLFINNFPDTSFSELIVDSDTADYYGIAWGDYDNDGDLDLAVANSGQNKLYRNNLNDNNYLKVRLIGLGLPGYTNKDGVGARVKVFNRGTSFLRGFREVSAGSGYGSMNSLEMEFGLPAGDTFDVEITWPTSGIICIQEDVVPPTILEILEEDCLTGIEEENSELENKKLNVNLQQNYPNPFRNSTIIHYQVSEFTHIKLNVYDISGKHIKTLVDSEQNTGSYEILWDGKDNEGKIVSSGIYFTKLIAGSFAEIKKVILLK
jgi:hypothetical protein